jgi:hypothetical protein
MAKRDNHYELAFEEFLRRRRTAYLAVDEARRALAGAASLKSLDFLVAAPAGGGWLVDVKGRAFPAGTGRQYWRNWSTQDDLSSLARWEQVLGGAYGGLLVFAYQVLGDRAPLPEPQLFRFRDALYGLVAIRLRDYVAHARRISPRWDTLAVPTRVFRTLARPFEDFL